MGVVMGVPLRTAVPVRVMMFMLATTNAESVTCTPMRDSGDPTGPMLYGITYIVRPGTDTSTHRGVAEEHIGAMCLSE
jgi:hypothetical protein